MATASSRDFSPASLKVLAGCLLGAFCSPLTLIIGAVAIAMTPIAHAFGWSHAAISGGVTLMLFVSALMTAVWGGVIDRGGVSRIIAAGTAGVSLFMLGIAFTPKSLVWFYVCFGGLAFAGSTAIGYNKLIAALFNRNRGKALAVFGMESTLVGVLIPPLLFALLRLYGWRGMLGGAGIIVLLIAPLLLFLLHTKADQDGRTGGGGAATRPQYPGLTGRETRRTREFWLLNGATMFGNLTATGLLPHIVALTLSHGMPASVAVAALSLQTGAIALGQVLGGYLLDRVDTPKVAVPFAVLAVFGLVLLAYAKPGFGGAPLLLTGAALLGFGNGAKRSMNTYFQTRFFGLKALAENSGWSVAITSFVLAPAPLLFGFIFDQTRSYGLALLIIGAGLFLAVLFYLLLKPYRYTVDAVSAAPEPALSAIVAA